VAGAGCEAELFPCRTTGPASPSWIGKDPLGLRFSWSGGDHHRLQSPSPAALL